jgi:ribosome-binding protein aMBF1 (putative translation factor)
MTISRSGTSPQALCVEGEGRRDSRQNQKSSRRASSRVALTVPAWAREKKRSSVLTLGFGNRLREPREARGMTQRDLADGVDIEVVQISRYERGLLLTGETSAGVAAADLNLDLRPLERFRDLQKLPRRDRKAVILLIDSVLTRGEVE